MGRILLLCFSLLLGSCSADEHKVPVVGVLQFTANNAVTLDGFKDGLREYGYEEGRTIRYVYDGPASSREQMAEQMERLLAAGPDLIFASPTPAAIVACSRVRGTGIPVVFAPVNDPVAAGILARPLQPEGNATGVQLSPSDGRRLESLKLVVPSVVRVFVPYTPEDKSARASLDMLQEAAPQVGVELVPGQFLPSTDLAAHPEFVPADIDAVLLPRDGLVMSKIADFVRICTARRLPLSTPRGDQVKAGALLGYGFDGHELGHQAARMARMILEGTPVSSLPVEMSADYLFVNLATADAIGVTVSDAVLRRAHVIYRKN